MTRLLSWLGLDGRRRAYGSRRAAGAMAALFLLNAGISVAVVLLDEETPWTTPWNLVLWSALDASALVDLAVGRARALVVATRAAAGLALAAVVGVYAYHAAGGESVARVALVGGVGAAALALIIRRGAVLKDRGDGASP